MFIRAPILRHLLCCPRIPDDGGLGIKFLHANRALELCIVDFHRAGVVRINTVGLFGDVQHRIIFQLARPGGPGGEIIKRRVLQAGERNLADVAAVKIGVQTSRKNLLLLNKVIEKGLNEKGADDKTTGIIENLPEEAVRELKEIAVQLLEKAGLTEMNEKLKSL